MEEINNKKQRYDFFFSYSQKDEILGRRIREILSQNKLTCYSPTNDFSIGGGIIINSVVEAIRSAKVVIIFLTNNYLLSKACLFELQEIVKSAHGYDRDIIPICLQGTSFNKDDKLMNYILLRWGFHFVDSSNFDEIISDVITKYKNKLLKEALYEKLNSYLSSNSDEEVFKTIGQICKLLPNKLNLRYKYVDYSEYYEYVSLLKILDKKIVGIEEETGILRAYREVLSSFDTISKIKTDTINENSKGIILLNLAIYLYVLILQYDLRCEYMDIVSDGRSSPPLLTETVPQLLPIRILYERLYKVGVNDKSLSKQYVDFVTEVISLLAKATSQSEYQKKVRERNNKAHGATHSSEEKANAKTIEKKLFEIANHINKSNELFENIADEEATYEFLICLKTSYERLKNYCDLVGCKNVSNYCVEKLFEINLKLDRAETKQESLKENCFKALLGFTLPTSGTYDIFVSYKHEDDDIASNIYAFLKQNLINAFYDKVTLPKLGKSEYHDAIMDSLDRSENFIVILSDLNYINSDWVKLEMSTFNKELTEGRKPGGNFIIVVTPDVYDEIRSTNKKCLPIQYRGCEIMLTTDYRDKLLSYIKKSE